MTLSIPGGLIAAIRGLAILYVCWHLTAPVCAAEVSPQLASIAAQRASIERQVASLDAQLASAQRQRASVQKQAAIVPPWKNELSLTAVLPAAYLDCAPLGSSEAEALIASAADRESLPPDLLRAVIKQESGFKPCAVSTMGAQGLMQLMPSTANDLRVEDPFDPKQNILGGAAYLKSLVNRYGGDLRRALGAYNAGIARVDRFDSMPEFAETRSYVNAITADLGYTQLPLSAAAYDPDDSPADEDSPAATAPETKPDFHRLVLPSPETVFTNLPDFKRFK